MRRTVFLLALCGCASAQSTPDDVSARSMAIVTTPETGMMVSESSHPTQAMIAAPPAAVWLAAKKVYTDMEIPVAVENPSMHQMGNANFYKTRQFAGIPMAQLVDCGSGMEGPKASSYRIYMSLLTTIASDGKGGTDVRTTFVAAGQDMSGSSSDRIPCGTSGKLEATFLTRLKNSVSGG